MFGSRKSMSLFLLFVVFVFLMSTLFLPLCFADETEPPPAEEEEEKTAFEQLQESLDEYLRLMSEGEVEEAFKALEEYLAALKELDEDPSELSEVEAHMAHILYVTSKHLEVLMRVYEKVPESAHKGLENALMKSTKGHSNAYKLMDRVEEETGDGDGEDGDDVETADKDEKEPRGQDKDKKDKKDKDNKGKKSE